jgi:hypothetical protein
VDGLGGLGVIVIDALDYGLEQYYQGYKIMDQEGVAYETK